MISYIFRLYNYLFGSNEMCEVQIVDLKEKRCNLKFCFGPSICIKPNAFREISDFADQLADRLEQENIQIITFSIKDHSHSPLFECRFGDEWEQEVKIGRVLVSEKSWIWIKNQLDSISFENRL